MAVHAGRHHANGTSVGKDRLFVYQQLIGVGELELQQSFARYALLLLCEGRFAPDKPPGFVPGAGKCQAGLDRCVLDADVVAPMPVALFSATGVERVKAGQFQAMFGPGLHQAVEHMQREFGRNVELPTQLAHIGDAAGTDHGVTDLDLLRGAEWECAVAEVGAADRRQQGA